MENHQKSLLSNAKSVAKNGGIMPATNAKENIIFVQQSAVRFTRESAILSSSAAMGGRNPSRQKTIYIISRTPSA
jgi:hypothetical protein